MAIFGNNSFFFTAANVSDISATDRYSQICQQASIPLLNLVRFGQTPAICPAGYFYFEGDSAVFRLASMMCTFMQIFNDSK